MRQTIAARCTGLKTGVSCSIGVSNCPVDGTLPEDLITVADTALYYAKYNGGNRVYISSSLRSSTLPVEVTKSKPGVPAWRPYTR